MKIKTTMRYQCTSIKIAQIKKKNLTIPTAENVEQQKFSFTVFGNAKWYIHFGGQFQFLVKLT